MKNKIILGTVQFGLNYGINNSSGKPSTQKIKKILDEAFKNGIRLLDTAEAYGNSQEKIGEYHQNSNNKFDVISKFSATQTQLPSSITQRVQNNINILNVSSLYGYMFHSFTEYQKYYSKFEVELDEMISDKKIKKLGVSLYTNEEVEQVLKNQKIKLIQLPFNLLDNTNFRKKILQKAKDQGVEIHTRSVFLQGLFFKNTNQLRGNLVKLKAELLKLHDLCTQENAIQDLALQYALSQPTIDRVLIGVDSVEQLVQNLSSLTKKIPEKKIKQIDNIIINQTSMLNPSNWK